MMMMMFLGENPESSPFPVCPPGLEWVSWFQVVLQGLPHQSLTKITPPLLGPEGGTIIRLISCDLHKVIQRVREVEPGFDLGRALDYHRVLMPHFWQLWGGPQAFPCSPPRLNTGFSLRVRPPANTPGLFQAVTSRGDFRGGR